MEIAIAVVAAGGIDTMLVGDDLPELGTNLVTALAGLKVDNLSHCVLGSKKNLKIFLKTQLYISLLTCSRAKLEMSKKVAK